MYKKRCGTRSKANTESELGGESVKAYAFPDIFDINSLQELTDSLSAALQLSISVRNPSGKRFTRDSEYGSFYQNILAKSPAAGELYEQFVSGLCAYIQPTPYVCRCQFTGLTDAVINIMAGDIHIASMLAGRIRLAENPLSDEEYREIARSLGTDEDAYLSAVHALPVMTGTQFHNILDMLLLLMRQLSLLGQSKLDLKNTISSLESQKCLHQQEKVAWESLAEKDSMTGLYNRRKFEEAGAAYSTEKDRKICMISADANFLKLTNDIFGHEAGDTLLQTIAKIMNDLAKSDWLVARCGGDEFRVILPDTTLETALDYCRRVARNCRHDKSLTLPLSVALGAAEWNSEAETLHDCFSRADAKMYQNKTALKHELRIPNYIMERLYDRQVLNKASAESIARMTYDFARYLKFTRERAKEISIAALYQDIGMAKLPESFVIRGQSRTEEEKSQMHMHVTHSYTMARQFDELYKIADIIHCTHENWNGKGYPGGLKGEQIPMEARIIHLASDYISRTLPTVTGGFYTEDDVRKCLADDNGNVYDPELAAKFLRFLHKR